MGLQLEDGTGNGYQAKIDHANRIHVYAVNESLEHHTNRHHGESYNLLFSQTADTSSSCIIHIKNLDDDDIIFEGITANAASGETLEIRLNDSGTPVNGIESTPVNLNTGFNNIANGIFQVGSNITGISGGVSAMKYFFKGGDSSKFHNFEQDIILSKNRILTMYCVNGNILVDGFLAFFFHHKD